MFQALQLRDFRLLWAGSLVSSLGSWLLTIAIPAHVLLATGSLRDTGLTLAAEYLPLLILGPVAGVVADVCDRRRLLITAGLFCAGAVAMMLLGTSPGRYWVLYLALIAENSGTVLSSPALQAMTPAVVGTGPLLSSANSLTSASGGIVRLDRRPAGRDPPHGLRHQDTHRRGFPRLCNGCKRYSPYIPVGSSAGGRRRADGKSAVRQLARDLRHGARALRDQPAARPLLPVTVIYLAANASLSALLIPLGIQRLGGGERTGLLLACLGAGFLLGAPVIRVLIDRIQPRNLLAVTLAATACGYFLLFSSTSLATALPAAVVIGTFGSMSLVIPQTTVQRLIPGAVLGRVSAIFLTGEAAATLAGAVAGPFLAQAAGASGLETVAAAASLLTLGAAALARLTVPRIPVSRADGELRSFLPNGPVVTPTRPPSSSSR